MCVILHALKKKHARREEILQAMRSNSAGFFLAALRPNGERDAIRTLDEKEAIKFFDDKVGDDDAFVMHARIPSRGEKTLDNVHGWQEDGVMFAHNMTLSELDDVMKEDKWDNTDSEYFFRKVFMPVYRALGESAYKDGKLDECLDRIVRIAVQGTNKFLFVMPDNGVLRYGNWVEEADRKEDGKTAFFASNSSYKVYERTWSAGTGVYDPDDSYGEYGEYGGYYYGRNRRAAPAKAADPVVKYDGATLAKVMGFAYLARTGFKTFVLTQAIILRQIADDETAGKDNPVLDEAEDMYTALENRVFGDCHGKTDTDLYEACDPTAVTLPAEIEAGSPEHMLRYIAAWGKELERYVETRRGKFTDMCMHLTSSYLRELAEAYENTLDAVLMMLNCCIDLDATSLDDALVMYVPGTTRSSRYAMHRAKTVDLVVPTACGDEVALSSATALLETIQKLELADENGEGDGEKPAQAGGKEK